MSNEFINNINLNSNNSLTHLIDTIFILDDNEPTILNTSHYYDNDEVNYEFRFFTNKS